MQSSIPFLPERRATILRHLRQAGEFALHLGGARGRQQEAIRTVEWQRVGRSFSITKNGVTRSNGGAEGWRRTTNFLCHADVGRQAAEDVSFRGGAQSATHHSSPFGASRNRTTRALAVASLFRSRPRSRYSLSFPLSLHSPRAGFAKPSQLTKVEGDKLHNLEG